MTGITITSKDAERIARSFNDLIGRKGLIESGARPSTLLAAH